MRIVTATNRELRSEVNSSTFRLDLYYRIAVVTLQMPPLRQRVEDIPMLVDHFLKAAGHEGSMGTVVSNNTLEELARYRWPGNVRELRNWVEAMLAIGEAPELSGDVSETNDPPNLAGMSYKDARAHVLADFEARYFRELLDECAGNVSKAARQARMDRSYLIKMLQRHGLK